MKCRRAFEADLLAVLQGESGDADFLAHYPSCPECAAEVAVWSELEGMLRVGAVVADAHPTPEALLAFTDAPATLERDVRGTIERHLESCRVCRDEIASLGAFDAAGLAEVHATATRVSAPAPRAAATSLPPRMEHAAAPGSRLGRFVWHPAFAYALVAVLLVPLLRDQLSHVPEGTRAPEPRRQEYAAAPGAGRAIPPPPPPPLTDERERDGAAFDALERPARELARPLQPQAGAPAARRAEGAVAERQAADEAPEAREARSTAPEERSDAPQARTDALQARTDALQARTADAPPVRVAESAPAAAPAALAKAGRDDEHPAAERESGGARSDRLRRSVPASAPRHDAPSPVPPAAAAGGAEPLVVELGSRRPTIEADVAIERGLRLHVVPPPDLGPGPLDVKLSGGDGQRELGVRVTDRADTIEIPISPRWLVPGDYEVTLRPVTGSGAGANATVTTLHFTVRAPARAERIPAR